MDARLKKEQADLSLAKDLKRDELTLSK